MGFLVEREFMLTLLADQPECLWDDAFPVEVKELPEDLAALDALLSDHELLFPIAERWRQEFEQTGRLVLSEGRPTIAMETYVRLSSCRSIQLRTVCWWTALRPLRP